MNHFKNISNLKNLTIGPTCHKNLGNTSCTDLILVKKESEIVLTVLIIIF